MNRSIRLSIFVTFACIAAMPVGVSQSLHNQLASSLQQYPLESWLDSMNNVPGEVRDSLIIQLVRGKCGTDFPCLYRHYSILVSKLERSFDLPAAITIAKEMVKISRKHQDADKEAKSHLDLSRFYDALGVGRLEIVHVDEAIRLFEKSGNTQALANAKFYKLEENLSFRSLDEVLPEMEAMLDEAVEKRDTGNISLMTIRLFLHAQSAGWFDKMEEYVSALERIQLAHPVKPHEFAVAIHSALGRANLYRMDKEFTLAEQHYQKALSLCAEEPSLWLEISSMHSLAEMEWERGNSALAKSYLDSAWMKADKLSLHEQLAKNFEIKATLAESEGRYADALSFTKQKNQHEEAFNRASEGFDLQKYLLQLANEQLLAEKENRELMLSLKKNQLRYSVIICLLFGLLAAGLFIGLNKHRKGKRELARQNALVRAQADQLKTLDKAKSRFFANVSHELRTPLTLIQAPVHTLLRDDKLDANQVRLLQIVSRNSKELEEMVNEILDLRKLEDGKMETRVESVLVGTFFKIQCTQFESLAVRNGILYSYETLIDDALIADLDISKCRQIIYNLLSNAFKFTQKGGHIRASLAVKDEILQFEVADSGLGIHPDDLPHVFDRFFQTTRPDKPAEGGTGIGLALCKEYSLLLGGDASVESALGKGSLFRVWFPVSRVAMDGEAAGNPQPAMETSEARASGEATPCERPALDAAKATILVVEDNAGLRDYLRVILSGKYNVLCAENGKAALDQLPTANCQLILSDLMMPVMDGFQLLDKLKSGDSTRHIPVIMLTARADLRDRLKALRIGVDDYIIKPFDEEELLARIENLLNNCTARHEAIAEDTVAGEAMRAISAADQEWLTSFEAYVRKNLSSDLLSVASLAREFTMSESTLLRQIRRLTGLTPMQYLLEMRLDRARELLERNCRLKIAKVASEVGYADARSFARSFKKRFGKPPSEMTGLEA